MIPAPAQPNPVRSDRPAPASHSCLDAIGSAGTEIIRCASCNRRHCSDRAAHPCIDSPRWT